jgi:hypothetical protein
MFPKVGRRDWADYRLWKPEHNAYFGDRSDEAGAVCEGQKKWWFV